jgi:hypothetical protein
MHWKCSGICGRAFRQAVGAGRAGQGLKPRDFCAPGDKRRGVSELSQSTEIREACGTPLLDRHLKALKNYTIFRCSDV